MNSLKRLLVYILAPAVIESGILGCGAPVKSTFKELSSLVQTKQTENLEDKFKNLLNKDNQRLFDDCDIEMFNEKGICLEYILEVSNLKFSDVKKVNSVLISQLFDSKIPLEYVKEVAGILDKEGEPYFSFFDIIPFYKAGVTAEYAKELSSFADKEGKNPFEAWNILRAWNSAVPFEYVRDITNILYSGSTHLFILSSITDFYRAGITIEYAKSLLSIKDTNGKPIFDDSLIARFKKAGGTVEFAEKLANVTDSGGNKVLNAYDIIKFCDLGLNKTDVLFSDTEKPNAVVVYPTKDWNGAFGNDPAKEFSKKIKEEYDVFVRTAEVEEQVYRAIDSIPNIELLILSGHGTKTTLSLGENDLANMKAEKDEKYTIDLTDVELGMYLQKLNPNAVIFMNSCYNAEMGGDSASQNDKNLANFISDLSSGRKVIACKEVFDIKDVYISSLYPFNIIIQKESVDVTYTNKK